jgi:hypothetical protein
LFSSISCPIHLELKVNPGRTTDTKLSGAIIAISSGTRFIQERKLLTILLELIGQ